MQLLALIYLRSLLRLRRHMRRSYPVELDFILNKFGTSQLDRAISGPWLSDLTTLQMACFVPQEFPVHVFADDKMFELVKRVRRGVLVQFYSTFGFIIIKSLKDL